MLLFILAATTASGTGNPPDLLDCLLEPSQSEYATALSPNGKRLAFATREEGKLYINVRDLDSGETNRHEVGTDLAIPYRWLHPDKTIRPAYMEYVEWPTRDRVVFNQLYGELWAMDHDGGNKVELLRYRENNDSVMGQTYRREYRRVDNLLPNEPDAILVESYIFQQAESYGTGFGYSVGDRYDYYWVNIHDGKTAPQSGVFGAIHDLYPDQMGVIQGGFRSLKDGRREFLVRGKTANDLTPVSEFIGRDMAEAWGLRTDVVKDIFANATILGFGFQPRVLYFASNKDRDTYAIYALDLDQKTVSAPLAESGRFDLDEDATLVYVPELHQLGGIRFQGVKEGTVWAIPEFKKAQAIVDKALPNTVNRIQDWDTSFNRFLIFSYSDRDPGTYYIFDSYNRTLKAQLQLKPSVDRRQMAQTIPMDIKNRNGDEILCYLTVPNRAVPGTPLPMVVNLHGGPWSRDYWEFDYTNQYLAANGYAVLQVNFRGSSGFGFKHINAARKHYGDAGRMDVEDAIQYLVDNKIADPGRLFVTGASYGGYLSMYLCASDPQLFKACISVAGVMDLVNIVIGDPGWGQRDWVRFEVRKELIGSPSKDKAILQKTSPINLADRFETPVLMLHGDIDTTVPPNQSSDMHRKLTHLGKPSEFILIENAKHGGWNPAQERMLLEKMLEFIQQHDPGISRTPAPAAP